MYTVKEMNIKGFFENGKFTLFGKAKTKAISNSAMRPNSKINTEEGRNKKGISKQRKSPQSASSHTSKTTEKEMFSSIY